MPDDYISSTYVTGLTVTPCLPQTMTIFSLYIFDRHCTCIYYQDWNRPKRPRPAAEGNILPGVSRAVTETASSSRPVEPIRTVSSLNTSTGMVVAVNNALPQTSFPAPVPQPPISSQSKGLPFDEEAKLVYGVVLSLRNMVKKISGRNEHFVNYRTNAYKLHLFETISGYKFILLSHPSAESLRPALRQLYSVAFLEFVVRNPAISLDSRQRGIDNEYFRMATDRFIRSLPAFS